MASLIREVAETVRQDRHATIQYHKSRLEERRRQALELLAKSTATQAKVYEARKLVPGLTSIMRRAPPPGDNEAAWASRRVLIDKMESLRGELQDEWLEQLILVENLDYPPESQVDLRNAVMRLGNYLGCETLWASDQISGEQVLEQPENELLTSIATEISIRCKAIATTSAVAVHDLHRRRKRILRYLLRDEIPPV